MFSVDDLSDTAFANFVIDQWRPMRYRHIASLLELRKLDELQWSLQVLCAWYRKRFRLSIDDFVPKSSLAHHSFIPVIHSRLSISLLHSFI